MADLIVDGTLDETNRNLKAIHEEFSNLGRDAKENGWIWGQRDLAKAMREFADNWYVHRDKINGRLGKLSDRVDKACQTWSEADKQLADSFEVQDSTHA